VVAMMSTKIWDATLCSLVEVNRYLGGTYCSIFRVEEYAERASKQAVTPLAASLFVVLEAVCSSETSVLCSTRLHDVVSQKKIPFTLFYSMNIFHRIESGLNHY
jgi:hypothetical protein